MPRLTRQTLASWVVPCLLTILAVSLHFAWFFPDQDLEEAEQYVYIPRNLEECCAELERILSPEEIRQIAAGTESDMLHYHHGLGTWIRNNWGLWRESRLSAWFHARGVTHPDNMSGIILSAFWRHLQAKQQGG